MSSRYFHSSLVILFVLLALLVVEFVVGPTAPWQVLAFAGLLAVTGGLSSWYWWTPVKGGLPSYFLRNRENDKVTDVP